MDILEENKSLKDNPFVAPEGYFETMGRRASSVVEADISRTRRVRRIVLPMVSIAASFAIAFALLLSFGLLNDSPGTDLYSDSSSSTMTDEEIIDYLIYTGAWTYESDAE